MFQILSCMLDILLEYASNICVGLVQVIAGAISQISRLMQVLEGTVVHCQCGMGFYDAHMVRRRESLGCRGMLAVVSPSSDRDRYDRSLISKQSTRAPDIV